MQLIAWAKVGHPMLARQHPGGGGGRLLTDPPPLEHADLQPRLSQLKCDTTTDDSGADDGDVPCTCHNRSSFRMHPAAWAAGQLRVLAPRSGRSSRTGRSPSACQSAVGFPTLAKPYRCVNGAVEAPASPPLRRLN